MYPEEVAARILACVERRRLSLRASAQSFFLNRRDLEFMKPIVRVLTLNTMRNFMLLDHMLEEEAGFRARGGSIKRWLARVIVYSVTIGRDKARLSRLRKLAYRIGMDGRVFSRLLNTDYKAVVRKLVKVGRIDIAYSFPAWLLKYLRRARIPNIIGLLNALLEDPPTWARISTHRLSRESIVKLLEDEGLKPAPDRDLEDCVMIRGASRGALSKTRIYNLGYVVIQDKASILVGHVVDYRGSTTIDLTCGAGLKVTHALQQGALRGVAQDINCSILADAMDLAKRLELASRLTVICCDSTTALPLGAIKSRDRLILLVDPPCSSIGRMALQPELKLLLTERKIGELIRLQYRILENAVRRAPRGSLIVYSTCTLTLEENEQLVKTLESEGFVEVLSQKRFIGSRSFIDTRIQRLYPHIHKTQGFTIAVMEVM